MGTYTLYFSNNQLADFNTINLTATAREFRINANHPADRLVSSGAIVSRADVAQWRFTVQGDDGLDGNGNNVVPDAPMVIEYSTDGGASWNNYIDNIAIPTDAVQPGVGETNSDLYSYVAREDEEGWMTIVANFGTSPNGLSGGAYGFMASDSPPAVGQIYSTDDFVINGSGPGPKVGEYVLPLCFTRGMKILTENGEVAVEALAVGDRIWTLDHGYQPLRFIYSWTSPSIGVNRAVIFEPATIGNDRPVHLSQEHRILLGSVAPELRANLRGIRVPGSGGDNFLVKASLLVNGGSVRYDRVSTRVEYFHLMFDQHELVNCHGSISESWQPKLANLRRDAGLRAELERLFPSFADLDRGQRVPARPELVRIAYQGAYFLVPTRQGRVA